MAFDTFTVLVGVYPDVESAEADYDLVKELHAEERLMDGYDAAVIHRREDGKVKITRKHETPTRVGGVLGGGAGLGHRPRGRPLPVRRRSVVDSSPPPPPAARFWCGGRACRRRDEPRRPQGARRVPRRGAGGLVVVGVTDMEARIEQAMRRSEKMQKKQLKADTEALERDAKEASGQ